MPRALRAAAAMLIAVAAMLPTTVARAQDHYGNRSTDGIDVVVSLLAFAMGVTVLVCFFVLCSNVGTMRKHLEYSAKSLRNLGIAVRNLDGERAQASREGLRRLDERNGFRGIALGTPIKELGGGSAPYGYSADGLQCHSLPSAMGNIGDVVVTDVYAAEDEGRVRRINVRFGHGRAERLKDLLEAAYGSHTNEDGHGYVWQSDRVRMSITRGPGSDDGYLSFSATENAAGTKSVLADL